MSQYPYQQPHLPYGQGSYHQDPLSILLAPAKRASIIMFILSGLMIPCGLFMGAVSTMDLSQLTNEPSFQLVEQQMATIGWSISGFLKAMAVIIVIPGFLLLILGVMVRRGGLGSIVSSIILCIILVLLAALAVLGGIIQASQGNGQALLGLAVWGVVLIALIFTVVFLFQAAKNAGAINAHRMGYQAQMQQYQQYSQQYQHPSRQPQSWQQPGGQWPQPTWPPQQPPQQQQQNWPPPPPSNPA